MGEYVPAGRSSAFTLPDGTDSADLIAILQDFADDTVNIHGDTITGNFTITGTVNVSVLQKGGVAVVVTSDVGVVKVCTSGTRPGSPAEGQLIYETDLDRVMAWDGAAWNQVGAPPPVVTVWDSVFLMMGA